MFFTQSSHCVVSDCKAFYFVCVYSGIFRSYLPCHILEHIQVGTSQNLFKSNAVNSSTYY